MLYVLAFVAGAAAGALVAWLWATARARAQAATRVAEAETRAGAAAGTIAELRAQVQAAAETASRLQQQLDAQQAARVAAETELRETRKYVEEQRKLLEESKARLSDTFKALSDEALKSNNAAFLALAKQALENLITEARGDLGKRQEAIDALVKPLAESLKRYEDHIAQLERSRQHAYGTLEEQLKTLSGTHKELQQETRNLVNALRSPQVRGRWGEVTLRRVVELAGMSAHCDFTEQVSIDTENGRLRPDMVVHLPASRDVVVDAKVSLKAYLEAVEAETEERRRELLAKHAEQVRSHMLRLSQKSYWDQFDQAPEFVVMFIPGESFFSAAVEQHHELLEDGMSRRVVLATPTTLIALLWAVAYGWRQQALTENARAISELGKQIYDRMGKLADYIADVGKALERAVSAYNQAVGSMEARLYPAARRFKELGAGTGDEIETIPTIESTTRQFTPPDMPED